MRTMPELGLLGFGLPIHYANLQAMWSRKSKHANAGKRRRPVLSHKEQMKRRRIQKLNTRR